MPVRVHVGDHIVEEMAQAEASCTTDDGRNVDGSDLVVAPIVEGYDKHGDRGVISDDPGEGEEVVDDAEEDGELGERDGWSLCGSEEGVADELRATLLDSNEAHEA